MKYKILMGSVLCVMCLLFFGINTEAENIKSEPLGVDIIAIDSRTGESIGNENIEIIDITPLDTNKSIMKVASNREEKKLAVKINLPSPKIQTFASSSQTVNENSVTAKITIVYDRNSNRQLKVSSFSGSWSVSNQLIGLHSRTANVRNSINNIKYYYPSGNSFNYSTGWGYHNENTAGNGRATSTVASSISGMSDIYITVTVHIPQFS